MLRSRQEAPEARRQIVFRFIPPWARALIGQFEEFELTEAEVMEVHHCLTLQDPSQGSPQAVAWTLCERYIAKALQQGDQATLARLYTRKALLAAEWGQNPRSLLLAAMQTDLLAIKKAGIRQVRILAVPDACAACQAAHLRVLDVDEALRNGPLPHRSCSTDLFDNGTLTCRCRYVLHAAFAPSRPKRLELPTRI